MTLVKTCCWTGLFGISAVVALAAAKAEKLGPGPFVTAFWVIQRVGSMEAADPRHDERTKASLAAALAKDRAFTNQAVANKLMDALTFQALAGSDGVVPDAKLQALLHATAPETRRRLLPAVVGHLDELTTAFDRIDVVHLAAGEQLADWVVANFQPGKALPVIFVCTGNSRRSILGATMGNVAAAYWGLPEVRFYSGGTAPSAFNSRTIAALKAIGIEIEPTGEVAKPGLEGSPNPMYLVRWGDTTGDAAPEMETMEFSKHYGDASNPQSDFAAIMVCSQSDAECPAVEGASRRISMPYLDPKLFDDSEYESAKYAERRDDLGRLMLAVMLKARRGLEAKGKIAPPAIAASADR